MVDERDSRDYGVSDEARFREAAAPITARMCADETTAGQLIDLLVACGRLPLDPGEIRPLPVVATTLARFAAFTERIIWAALAHAVEDDEPHLERIRRFFLRPQETYSIEELASLWRIDSDDVRDIHHDELSRRATLNQERAGPPRIARADAVATTVSYNILRPFDVERALGAEFSHARGEAWRTTPILVHVPSSSRRRSLVMHRYRRTCRSIVDLNRSSSKCSQAVNIWLCLAARLTMCRRGLSDECGIGASWSARRDTASAMAGSKQRSVGAS